MAIRITNVSSEERFTLQVGTIAPQPSTYGYSTTVDGVYYFVNTSATNGPFYITTAEEFEGTKLPLGTYYVGGTDARNTIRLGIYSNQSANTEGFTFDSLKVDNTALRGGTDQGGSHQNFPVYAFAQWKEGSNSYIGLFRGHKSNESQALSTVPMYLVAGASAKFFDEASAVPYDIDNNYGDTGDPTGAGGTGDGIPDGDSFGGYDPIKDPLRGRPIGSGLMAYRMTMGQIADFLSYLWGSSPAKMSLLWDRFQNYYYNPMKGIVNCIRLPAQFLPNATAGQTIKIAGTTLTSEGSPPATGALVTETIKHVHGDVPIPFEEKSYSDFTNTKIVLHLPFCGVMEIDPSACMGGSISVDYYCDVYTGDCGAIVCTTDQFGYFCEYGGATGNCAQPFPLTGNDMGTGQVLSSLSGMAASLTGAALTGNAIGAVGSLVSGAGSILTSQHNTQIIGNPAGGASWLSSWWCYVEIYYPEPILTNNYDREFGRPSYVSGAVGDFSGYNEIEMHADSISIATDEEKREIEKLCASGIII